MPSSRVTRAVSASRSRSHSGRTASAVHQYEVLVKQLSVVDRDALEELSYDPPRSSIASHHAHRFLELGLAELYCGRLILTRDGLTALAAVREL